MVSRLSRAGSGVGGRIADAEEMFRFGDDIIIDDDLFAVVVVEGIHGSGHPVVPKTDDVLSSQRVLPEDAGPQIQR